MAAGTDVFLAIDMSKKSTSAQETTTSLHSRQLPEEITKLLSELSVGIPQYVHSTIKLGPDALLLSVQNIENALTNVNAALHLEVAVCHELLLRNVNSVDEIEAELEAARVSVNSMVSALSRIHNDFVKPVAELRTKLNSLTRLLVVQEIIQKCRRIVSRARLLRSLMESTRPDLAEAADILNEIESLMVDTRLYRIDIISDTLNWVVVTAKGFRADVLDKFDKAYDELNTVEISGACRALHNMNQLETKIEEVLESAVADMGKLSKRIGLTATRGTAVSQFCGRIEDFCCGLKRHIKRFTTLKQVLTFIYRDGDFLNNSAQISGQRFLNNELWCKAAQLLNNEVQNVCKSGSEIIEAISLQYPELLRSILSVINFIVVEIHDPTDLDLKTQLGRDDIELFVKVFQQVESAYFTVIEKKLRDTVAACFSSCETSISSTADTITANDVLNISKDLVVYVNSKGENLLSKVPTAEDAESIVAVMSSYVSASLNTSNAFVLQVSSVVCRHLLHFVTILISLLDGTGLYIGLTFDDNLSTGYTQRKLTSSLCSSTPAHAMTAAIYETLCSLHSACKTRFWQRQISEAVGATLEAIRAVADATICGWVEKVRTVVCDVLIRQMHFELEEAAGRDNDPTMAPHHFETNSSYMKQIVKVVSHTRQNFFALLSTNSAQKLLYSLYGHIIQVYTSHVVLLSNLTPMKRTIVASDIHVLNSLLLSPLGPSQDVLASQCGALNSLSRAMLWQLENFTSSGFGTLDYLPTHILSLHILGRLGGVFPQLSTFIGVENGVLADAIAKTVTNNVGLDKRVNEDVNPIDISPTVIRKYIIDLINNYPINDNDDSGQYHWRQLLKRFIQ